MVRELGLPFGVVINRVGAGDDRVHVFCREEGVPIFMEIPDDRRIAEAYSRGELMVDALGEYRGLFEGAHAKRAGIHERDKERGPCRPTSMSATTAACASIASSP
jgi:MinD superfamily P-loop ATPase